MDKVSRQAQIHAKEFAKIPQEGADEINSDKYEGFVAGYLQAVAQYAKRQAEKLLVQEKIRKFV